MMFSNLSFACYLIIILSQCHKIFFKKPNVLLLIMFQKLSNKELLEDRLLKYLAVAGSCHSAVHSCSPLAAAQLRAERTLIIHMLVLILSKYATVSDTCDAKSVKQNPASDRQ